MSYISLFSEILQEQQDNSIFPEHPTVRDIEVFFVPGKATILKGVRRAGKSVLLQMAQKIKQSSQIPAYSLNFSDERLAQIRAHELNDLIEAIFSINKYAEKAKKIHLSLDEIQLIPKWEFFVDRLLRQKKFQIGITGSSSRLLSKEIATEMRGRSISFEVFPFSFCEYLKSINEPTHSITTTQRVRIRKNFKNYLIQGGFPELLHCPPQLHRTILQEYYESIFFRDLVERLNLSDPAMAKATLQLVTSNHAAPITLNKTFDRLKSQGYKLQKSELSKLFKGLEDCYSFFFVPVFSESINRQNSNPKKVYCVDQGLINAVRTGLSPNTGRLLEGVVFIHLRRTTEKIWYYKSTADTEVDFLTVDSRGKTHLIQVTESLSSADTRQREIQSLQNAMTELKLSKGVIITLDEERIQDLPRGITVLPSWRFLTEGNF